MLQITLLILTSVALFHIIEGNSVPLAPTCAQNLSSAIVPPVTVATYTPDPVLAQSKVNPVVFCSKVTVGFAPAPPLSLAAYAVYPAVASEKEAI